MKLVSVVLLLLAPVLTSCFSLFLPLDCNDIYNHDKSKPSGVYTIYPNGPTSDVQVYCDMDSVGAQGTVYCDMDSDGGRWTVFQRRIDGSVNFYRPWDQYKKGFGIAAGEYWLGLENLYHLTRTKKVELLVDLEDFDGNKVFARYSSFSIESESNGYKLHVSGFKNGGAGDGMTENNGQKFSTFDKDQDSNSINCAKHNLGAFWYNSCGPAELNGVYCRGADGSEGPAGVEWYPWKGWNYSLKTVSMKIRPVQ